jgi:hypothetical protein
MQDDDFQKEEEGIPSEDLENVVEELMTEFDLDEDQAAKLKKLEDEGYDEEDALAKVMDA